MSRYAGRHRSAPHQVAGPRIEPAPLGVATIGAAAEPSFSGGPRSRTRRVARVVGGAAAVSLLGIGAVSSMSLAKVTEHRGSAVSLPVVPQEAALEAVSFQADVADRTDQRIDAGRTVNLKASAAVDAAREAERQAAATAAADAQAAQVAAAQAAQAGADAAAADAARKAEADRAARDAERQAVSDAAAKADPRSTARAMLAGFGWSPSQFSCLDSLWTKESGWNPLAVNKSSGAYGIPQSLPASKMATAGADYRTNAATQITWGLTYIKASYGSPCSAWAHSQAVNWY